MNLSIDNYLDIFSLVFAAIGGIFIYYQWRKSIKIRRAEFINQILEKLRFDQDLTNAIYTIDYNQEWYNSSFHNSKLEHSIDKLFCYMDYICYLRYTKNISNTELKIFQYEIHRICISYSSRTYLWNLYHFSLKNGTPCTFQNLIDYGIKNKMIEKDFKSNMSLFPKYLNW